MMRRIAAALLWACALSQASPQVPPESARSFSLEQLDDTTGQEMVEIRGVGAGAFAPGLWQQNTLHWVRDCRWPMLEPRQGAWRNIYAPSAVELPGHGWILYYGAWDGVPTGNDRIYRAFTSDFLGFCHRSTIIEHGPFQHVCNVNALRAPDGTFHMVCTAYPDSFGRNKPILFQSPDGIKWNGSHCGPYTPKPEDIVQVAGYPNYSDADINGMNVLLNEGGCDHLYFSDFRNFGVTWHATRTSGTTFTLDTKVLEGPYAVNDVKKFAAPGKPWYLMGLHMNGPKIWYSLSQDPRCFGEPRELFNKQGEADQYMVAVGWVVQGEQEAADRKLLGVLYGAGSKPSLDANRIFARWLQKRLVFCADETQKSEAQLAMGPERVLLPMEKTTEGQLEVYGEDGKTFLGKSAPVKLEPGHVYRLSPAEP